MQDWARSKEVPWGGDGDGDGDGAGDRAGDCIAHTEVELAFPTPCIGGASQVYIDGLARLQFEDKNERHVHPPR